MREGAKIIAIEKSSNWRVLLDWKNAILDASGVLSIGSRCSIGLSVFVWTHSSHLAKAYHSQFNLPVVTVRPFNVYGPGQTGEGAIQKTAEWISRGGLN